MCIYQWDFIFWLKNSKNYKIKETFFHSYSRRLVFSLDRETGMMNTNDDCEQCTKKRSLLSAFKDRPGRCCHGAAKM